MSDEVRWPLFAQKFTELLEKKGVTLYRLDEDTPLRSSNMSKVARGIKRPTDDILKILASYEPLGIGIDTLKGWRALDEYGIDAVKAAYEEAKRMRG